MQHFSEEVNQGSASNFNRKPGAIVQPGMYKYELKRT